MGSIGGTLLYALRIYWKGLFVVIIPFLFLPVFLVDDKPALRCLYVVMVMAAFWVTEALPLPVTSLIPMVLFPLMSILDSGETSICYLKDTNMMFVGGLIIAIAVEHCNLHRRVALAVILLVGCSPRKLNFGLVAVAMFVSMWISNTAAIAMMVPIIDATLRELENQGIGQMFEKLEVENGQNIKELSVLQKKPSRATICYFLSGAYAASIGGLGCIVGSGTNLTFKGIYETTFPKSPDGIAFAPWMFLNVPMMLLIMSFTWVWLQILFMGLFRPNSEDAKRIRLGKEGETVARNLMKQKMDEMGPMSFHEIAVGLCFILAVCLWFFRKPQFIKGWAELITDYKVEDATAALIVVMILFIVPAEPNFIYLFSKDESKRPKNASPGLITWKVIQQKLPWGLIFLLGGGFALAEGSEKSGMSALLAEYLKDIIELPKFLVLVITSIFATFLTQFTSNVAIANVFLPVLAVMSRTAKWHPLYLMMPAALSCSNAYCLQVATPPNAIAGAMCNIPTKDMLIAGLGVIIISLSVLFGVFPFLGEAIYDLETFPEWAA